MHPQAPRGEGEGAPVIAGGGRDHPGVAAGALLCFIPIAGEFVIPDLLAGSDNMMIGQTLWLEFFTNRDWPVASTIAIVLLVLLLAPLLIYEHIQRRQLESR